MSVFFKLVWFFRQEWPRYSIAIVALVCVGLLVMVPPWLTGTLVDAIADGTLTQPQLFRLLGWIALVAFLSYLLRVVWRVALFGASYTLARQLRLKLFQHLTSQPPAFFQRHNTGDLMARATNDIQAIEMTAGEAVLALFDGAFTGLIVLIILTTQFSLPLTLFALIPWPIVGFFMWRFGKELHISFRDAQARFSDLNDDVQESLSGIRVTRAFGREAVEQEDFNHIAAAANEANQRVATTDSKYDPAIQLAIGMSFFMSVVGGSWLIYHGQLTLGELTSFTLYLGYMIWPMFAVGWLLNLVERGQAAYRRLEELFEIRPLIADQGTYEDKVEPSLAITIRQFKYDVQSPLVLKDIAIQVSIGQTLGIVGHTGAGKTTLLNILLRHEESPDTDIRLGGKQLADFSLHNLRRHLVMVPQTPFLFSASVAENIALAKPDASLAEIEAVARIAEVHDDIMRFPDAYQTMVGERGITLSGGQKQRIAIARALLQDAPILILDDALSAVDVRTEQKILEHLRDNRAEKTTIIVCHRLTAIEKADQIIVLQHGETVENGTHRSLLQAQGWYRQMYDYQQLERAVEEGR